MSYRRLLFVIPVLVLLLPLSVAFADDDFDVTLSTEVYCDVVDFTINVAKDPTKPPPTPNKTIITFSVKDIIEYSSQLNS